MSKTQYSLKDGENHYLCCKFLPESAGLSQDMVEVKGPEGTLVVAISCS